MTNSEHILNDNFKKLLNSFSKENNIKINSIEFKKLIRHWDEYLSSMNLEDNNYGKEYNKNSEEYKKISEFQDLLVQQCIDFINNNHDIQEMINKKYIEVYNEWNKDRDIKEQKKFKFIPDTRIYFSIDGLDESLKMKKWVAATDSSFDITCGNSSVISRY